MTDIQAEKPKSYLDVKRGCGAYDEIDMDAYLKKVTDVYTKELYWQQDRFVKANDKIEAAKVWIIDTHKWAVGRPGIVHLLSELSEILETE